MALFFDPIFFGRWPASVMQGVGTNLPALDPTINGSHMGVYFMNHYTTHYTRDVPASHGFGQGKSPILT